MVLNKLINICITIIILFIIFSSFANIPILVAIGVIAIVVLCMYKFNLKNKTFLIIFILISLLTKLLCFVLIETPLESDFKTLYDISQDLLDGKLNQSSNTYLKEYPYQAPYVIYQSLLLKICNNLNFLKIVNIFICVLIDLLIYLIAKRISSEKSARTISLLYVLFAFPTIYITVITNQFISTLLMLLGILVLFNTKLENRKVLKYICCGILIGLSNLMRPEAVITVIAILCYIIKNMIINKEIKKNIVIIVSFLLTYIIITTGTMGILKQINLIPKDSREDLLWKFVCGLNYEGKGRWNSGDLKLIYNNNLTYEERTQLEKELIAQRLDELPNHIYTFKDKIKIYWSNFEYVWSFNYLNAQGNYEAYNKLVYIFNSYDTILWFFVLIMAVISVIRKQDQKSLLNIILIGTFIIYLFIEVQGRYSFYPQILLFIISSSGIEACTDKIKKGTLKNG